MTTSDVLRYHILAPNNNWQPSPAPNSIHFAKSKNSLFYTLCADTYLNSQIFGKDYEWSLPNIDS